MCRYHTRMFILCYQITCNNHVRRIPGTVPDIDDSLNLSIKQESSVVIKGRCMVVSSIPSYAVLLHQQREEFDGDADF